LAVRVVFVLGSLLLPAALAGWLVGGAPGVWVAAAGAVLLTALLAFPGPRAAVRRLPLLLVVLSAAYIAVRVWAFWGAFSKTPPPTPDTLVYEATSRLPLLSGSFWTGWEPWGMPLFYRVLPGRTAGSAPLAQWAISVAAWLVLAAVVATFVRSRILRAIAFAVVLGFSLAWVIGQWDGILLTESLSLSEAALLVAALLVCVRAPRARNAALVLMAALALAATRDASGYLAALLVLPAAAVVWASGSRRMALLLAVGAALLVAMVMTTSQVRRWELFLRDTIAIRVLPSPSATAFFVARGMPASPGLESELYDIHDPPSPFPGNPSLDALHTWFEQHGRRTLMAYLIRHPGVSVGRPLEHLDVMLGPTSAPVAYVVAPGDSWSSLTTYRQPGYRPPLPSWLEGLFYPFAGWTALAAMVVAVVFMGLAAFRRAARGFWIVPASLMLAVIPFAVIVWDATPEEIARHSLLVGVLGRLGVWLAVFFVLDATLARRPVEENAGEGPVARMTKAVTVG
jgi:hypothetical protein